ncbi:MAG TPA: molybdate ABC transporter substrate-binding protein [Candidatus Dormibacteraeota bacterium]
MRRALLLATAAAISVACGSQPATNAAPPKTVTVFAAASLNQVFPTLQTGFQKDNPGYRLTFNFAGTQTLITQLQQGASADLFASADEAHITQAETLGLLSGQAKDFARNQLEIAVAPGNPKHIETLADLARADVTLVLAGAAVPAGKYALQALQKAAVVAKPKSLEVDVESVLAKVELGEADAGIVYTTDVKAAGSKVQGVVIPAAQNVVATYPAAVLHGAPQAAGARAFLAYLLTPAAQAVLRRYGFAAP